MSEERDENRTRDTVHDELAPGEDLPTSAGGARPVTEPTTDPAVAARVFDEIVSGVIDRHIDAFKDSLKNSVHEILDRISEQALKDRQEMVKLQGRVATLERNMPTPDDGK